MTTPSSATSMPGTSAAHPRRWVVVAAVAWIVAAVLVLPAEIRRIVALAPAGPLAALFHWNVDTTPYLPLLLAGPFVFRAMSRRTTLPKPPPSTRRSTVVATSIVAVTSLLMSLWVARQMQDAPPAYHDEYSYLFQAKTFLAGRTWFPSPPEPRLFDQMHVLNEGRFACRYLPGTGLWLMPFVALGQPYAAQWLAGALCAALVLQIGCELSNLRAGFIAGFLTALSPGLALFSNLLLAHHPTLLGLMLFVWAFLRMQRTGHSGWAWLSGLGLTFAMFCRPMTAAGVGLPFGVWLFASLIRQEVFRRSSDETLPLRRLTLALGVPVIAGLGLLGWYNQQLTGSVWLSPYQQYTDVYTPRHVYGFNNVVRGEQKLGPRVIEQYDRWAENLTPELAAKNVGQRIVASSQWTLGPVPLAMLLTFLPVCLFAPAAPVSPLSVGLLDRRGALLVAAAIVSLHLVHVPYWFVGIMGWHYVFESAPLLLLLAGIAGDQILSVGEATGSRGWDRWWRLVLLAAVLMNVASCEPLWTGRLWLGVSEVRYPRWLYARFRLGVREHVTLRPAIVLVKPDPADRHVDYVTNDPDLSGPILIARFLKDVPVGRIQALYPDRAIYLFDVSSGRWELLSRPGQLASPARLQAH